MALVAMSAAYGTHGAAIGPAVAERLDVPFVDRAIAHRVAQTLHVSFDEAVRQWDPPPKSLLERMVSAFLGADTFVPLGPPPELVTADDFRQATEAAVLRQAQTGAGVILGRASVAILHDDPHALRVRLTGPRERRLQAAVRVSGLSAEDASTAMDHLDRYHAEYLRHFYGVDIDDPAAYHLTLDATAFDEDAIVGLIVRAARTLR